MRSLLRFTGDLHAAPTGKPEIWGSGENRKRNNRNIPKQPLLSNSTISRCCSSTHFHTLDSVVRQNMSKYVKISSSWDFSRVPCVAWSSKVDVGFFGPCFGTTMKVCWPNSPQRRWPLSGRTSQFGQCQLCHSYGQFWPVWTAETAGKFLKKFPQKTIEVVNFCWKSWQILPASGRRQRHIPQRHPKSSKTESTSKTTCRWPHHIGITIKSPLNPH